MAMGGSGRSETVTNRPEVANRPAGPQSSRLAGQKKSPPGILLVGASVRWAAESLRRSDPTGRIEAMDQFGDADTLAACDAFHRIDEPSDTGLVSACFPETLPRAIRVGGLRGLTSHRGRNELERLYAIAIQTGFSVPETHRSATSPSKEGIWLAKQTQSTGGLGIRFAAKHAPAVTNVLWQRWIPGRAHGVVALADARRVRVLGTTRSIHQRIGDLPFVYAGSRGPIVKDGPDPSAMQSLCEGVAGEFGIRGLFNLDFVRDVKSRWWLLELNARPSGSCEMIESAATHTGRLDRQDSLMRMHIDAIDGGTPTDDWLTIRCTEKEPLVSFLKRVVFARDPVVVRPDAIADEFNRQSLPFRLADIPSTPTSVNTGEPMLTLLSNGPIQNQIDFAQQLRRAIRLVQTPLRSTTTQS